MIKINQLSKNFGDLTALKDISLEISNSSVTSLIGPNGSGKSTLIKLILGLIQPTKGKIDFIKSPLKIGYMPEISGLPTGYTGNDILKKHQFILGYNRDESFNQLLNLFEMNSFLGKKFKGFSKGMQKKIGFLLAFAGSPDLVILDEPFEGIDTLDRDRLNEFIKSYVKTGKCVLLSSHILYDMDLITDQAVFLKKGEVKIIFNPKLNDLETTNKNVIELNPSDHGVADTISLSNPTITDIYRSLYK